MSSSLEHIPQATTLEQIKQRPNAPFGLLLFRVPERQPSAIGPHGVRLEKTSTQEPTGQTSRDGKMDDDWEPDADNWKD